VDRDPRGHVVSVAYYALVNLRDHQVHAATDAAMPDGSVFMTSQAVPLTLLKILQCALDRLRGKLRYRPVGFDLVPQKLALSYGGSN
jgi:8-oxo-dGTP diphosphatase